MFILNKLWSNALPRMTANVLYEIKLIFIASL